MAEAIFTYGSDNTCFRGSTDGLDLSLEPGGEEGPRSIDLLLLALGSCTMATVGHYMRRKSLPMDGLQLVLSSELNESTNRYTDISVKVFVENGIPEKQKQTINSVAKACRIHKTLKSSPNIHIDVCRAPDRKAV